MGTVLSAAVPSIAQPAENYVSDLVGFDYVQGLGSTRFMKVVKCKYSDEGPCVVKVFVYPDPSFFVNPYREHVERVTERLASVSNCLPFQRVVITDKAAMLVRQFGNETLYDRQSCRPFLTAIEKKWIAFQLLKALQQCHAVNVCHGDIKSQNVLVSSWGWVHLTDFASFKPAFVPLDNPSDFTYFFDTSRRRTCYLAPERFLSAGKAHGVSIMDDHSTAAKLLTHEMDVFALGCVLAELFSDGRPPFDLSQLLLFRRATLDADLAAVDAAARPLIARMLQRDQRLRPTADRLLTDFRDTFFPASFYAFLWPFLEMFVRQPLMDFDEMVAQFSSDFDKLLKHCSHASDAEKLSEESVVALNLALSLVRKARSCSSRLRLIDILCEFARRLPSAITMERVLPYLVFCLNDVFPRVRAKAIHSINLVLAAVNEVSHEDSRIFVDYLFPRLGVICADPSSLVRSSLAAVTSQLAETSARMFNEASAHLSGVDPQAQAEIAAAESGLQRAALSREQRCLHDAVQELVVTLLCDADNHVKRTLAASHLPLLCHFFGKQKASDVLLSHMITFLNDKVDWRLRSSFFEHCLAPASYIGWQSTLVLKPLLQQGLRDFEETVVFHTLACLAELAQQNLLQKQAIYDLLPDILPFLSHPNGWIRIAAVGFLSGLARTLNVADMHCKVMPLVSSSLSQPLIKLDKQALVLRCLRAPLPRSVWGVLLRSPLMAELMDFLRDKHLLRRLHADQHSSSSLLAASTEPAATPDRPQLAALYQKLRNHGLDDDLEQRLLLFAEIFARMRQMRASLSEEPSPTEAARPGTIDLARLSVTRRHADLTVRRRARRRGKAKQVESAISTAMNEEWQHMFGSTGKQAANAADNDVGDALLPPESDCDGSQSAELVDVADATEEALRVDTTPAMDSRVCLSECRQALSALVEWKRDEWLRLAGDASLADDDGPPAPPNAWAPVGQLVANLHEHRAAVNRLAVHGNGRLFASCSADGTVKLWDCQKLESRSLINRSRHTYSSVGDRVRCVVFLPGGERLACSSEDCRLHVLGVRAGAAPLRVIETDANDEGHIIEMASSSDGCGDVLVGVTHHGCLVCWDLRQRDAAVWRARNRNEHGLITAFCVDPRRTYWASVGTTIGRIVTWDLRFQLAVNMATHPSARPLVRLWSARGQSEAAAAAASATVWCAVAGNGEVCEVDLATGSRLAAVWPSSAPPLSYQQHAHVSTTALIDRSSDSRAALLLGDSTGVLRLCDFGDTRACSLLSAPAGEAEAAARSYSVQTVEGIPVLTELSAAGRRAEAAVVNSIGQPLDAQVSTCHRDAISDAVVCNSGAQWFLASASRDGVIKMWK